MKLKNVVLGILALTASAAASQDFIIGGVEVSSSDPVAASTVALYDGSALCTGSIIAKDLVVTAAHCIPTDAKTLKVYFRTDLYAAGKSAKVVDAVVNPGYQGENSSGPDENDIALVRFSGNLPSGYAPATLLPERDTLRNGETVTLAGYGINEAQTSNGAGVLRRVDVTISNASFGKTEVLFDQTAGKGACHGDSGGPAFATIQSKLYLFGVTNRGYPDDAPDDCAHQAVYTNIISQMTFLNSAANKMGSSIGN